ncbi:ImuA family protein [Devosia sp. CN2-171]|uniref:ImuA family protein n=1 Tax=Devosia sp. CN2-171 TaxID=3400909 RepID=UPI003BF8C1E0
MGLARPDLEALRAKIAALENRPLLVGDAVTELGQREPIEGDAALLSPPAGVLHEVFADEQRNGGSTLGFALGLARGLLRGNRQALIYLQLASEAQDLGLPYGIGLQGFGIDPSQVVIGRIETLNELFWAIEEAIACRAVAGIVTDIMGHPKALDFTVSRRLSLRAAAAGTSVFILRYGREREASSAKLRWRVSPHLSAEEQFDPQSPGPPRFEIEIEKRRLGNKTQRAEGKRMIVDWTENGFVPFEPWKRPATRPHRTAPLPRAFTPALGDRLSEAS